MAQEDRSHRRDDSVISIAESSTKGAHKLKDPFRCAMCLRLLMCPRKMDYDEYMIQVNLNCIHSSDPVCKVVVKSEHNKNYLARITNSGHKS